MRATSALFMKQVKYRFAYPFGMVNLAVGPFFIIGPYVFVAKMYSAAYLRNDVAIGLILWYWLSTFFWGGGFGIRDEMEEGVLESIAVTPASLRVLLYAKAVDSFVVSLYITISTVLWLYLFANVSFPSINFGMVIVFLMAALSFTGLGILYSGLVLLTKQASQLGNLTQEIIGIVSGMTAPTSILPRAVRWLSSILPLTYAIRGAREAFTGRFPTFDIVILVVFSVSLFAIGLFLFSHADRRLRVAGTLGEF